MKNGRFRAVNVHLPDTKTCLKINILFVLIIFTKTLAPNYIGTNLIQYQTKFGTNVIKYQTKFGTNLIQYQTKFGTNLFQYQTKFGTKLFQHQTISKYFST